MAETLYTLGEDDVLYFPFDAELLPDGRYDREWHDKEFASFFNLFLGDGIYPNPSDNLQVKSLYNTMILTVSPGTAMIQGRGYRQGKAINITISASSPTLKRIDDIVLRLDKVKRIIAIIYRTGALSATPSVSALIRNDDIYELRLAEITVGAGVSSITTANIRDTRLDKSVCGVVSQMVQSVDTTTLFKQYEAYINEKISAWNKTQDTEEKAWQAQTKAQQDTWQAQTDTQKNSWDSIKGGINADLQRYATFNFDNWGALAGMEIVTSYPTGKMLKVITAKNGLKVAEREITWATMTAVERVYQSDGKTILRETTKPMLFKDGTIKEVIS